MAKPKRVLQPSGDFPPASFIRRLAAIFYDFLLCVALVMVVTLLYQQGVLRLIHGGDQLRQLAEAGALDRDPILATLLLFSLFGFFAKFWTWNGQTLGMQVWGIRVQNPDGSAIDLWQALLRFVVAIGSWLFFGLGFLWQLWDRQKRTWHDIYSDSQVVRLPKDAHKKK